MFSAQLRVSLSPHAFLSSVSSFSCSKFQSFTLSYNVSSKEVFGDEISGKQEFFFLILAVALISVILCFVIMMIFSGFIVDLETVFPWLSWIQWISAFRYASNVLTINEFRHLILCQVTNMTNVCLLTGEQVLDQRNLDYAKNWDIWKYFLGLTIMAMTFLILAYIQLLRIKKTR